MAIYIIKHKATPVPKKEDYVSLQVGACRGHIDADYYDDEGLNISNKNASYCELTGLYWIWKHSKEDMIGMVHYRRFFSRTFGNRRIINASDLKKKLKTCDVILPFHHTLPQTVREHYCENSGYARDLEILEEVIGEVCPEYLPDFQNVMDGHKIYFFNMLAASEKVFKAYCAWLFSVLEETEARIDISGYDEYKKRIYGFMGERLLSVYVRHHHLKVCEVGVINTAENWPFPKKFLTGMKRTLLYFRRGKTA